MEFLNFCVFASYIQFFAVFSFFEWIIPSSCFQENITGSLPIGNTSPRPPRRQKQNQNSPVAPKVLDAQKLASKLEKLVLAPIREIPPQLHQILLVDKLKHQPAPPFSLHDFWRRLFRAKSCENVSKNDREIVQESRKTIVVTVPMPEITSSLKVAKKKSRKTLVFATATKTRFQRHAKFDECPCQTGTKKKRWKKKFTLIFYSMSKFLSPVVVLKCSFDLKACVSRWQTVVLYRFRWHLSESYDFMI